MRKMFFRCCLGILLFSCKKENAAPKPLVSDSKVFMLIDGVAWESNQAFNGTSATAYNISATSPEGSKWQTGINAQNSAENYLYIIISYNAKPQVDKEYTFQLASFQQNGKEYAAGPVIGTSGTVKFTAITATSLSGTFTGKLALIEGASTVAGYATITEGKFTNIKYNP